MANFKIIILDPEVTVPSYTLKSVSRDADECVILDNSNTMKFVTLLDEYALMDQYSTEVIPKEIVITEVTKQNSGHYIAHNGVEITIAMLPYIIDVTSGDPILDPAVHGLSIEEYFQPTLATTTLTVDFYIKGISTENGPTVSSTYTLIKQACPGPEYTDRLTSKTSEDCILLGAVSNVKFVSPNSSGTFIPGITTSYTGANPHDKLVITSINTTPGLEGLFYFQYNTTPLTAAELPLEIDINAIAEGDNIPNLTVEENFYPPKDRAYSILNMTYYIEDTLGNPGASQTSQHIIYKTDCVAPPACDPYITNLVISSDDVDTDFPLAVIATHGNINCSVDIIQLDGSSSSGTNLTYLWTTIDGEFEDENSVTTPYVLINSAGTYTLRVKNGNNSLENSTNTVVTSAITTPTAIIVPAATELTSSVQSINLDGSTSIGTGLTYLWSDGNTDSSISVTMPGTYTLIVTDTNGCIHSTNQVITQEVLASISGATSQPCDLVSWVLPEAPEAPVIDATTYINIFFDSSGSMDDTLPALEEARDNELKALLLPAYGTEANYNDKVRIVSSGEERVFKWMYYNIGVSQGTVINLIFSDEAIPNYHGMGTDIAIRSKYITDIGILRPAIDSVGPNSFRGTMFHILGDITFKPFLQAVEASSGSYAGIYGLVDKTQISFEYDLPDNETSQYYTDRIQTALNNHGFTV